MSRENLRRRTLDPEPRLVFAVVPGARSIENAQQIVQEVRRRVDPEVALLLTGDESPAYETAIEHTFGRPVEAPKGPGRPRIVPERRLPETVVYATVHKERQGHRVVAVTQRQVFGTASSLATALERSEVSHGVNTSFVERQNGADRGRNARKSSRFSKDWRVHEAMTFLTIYAYNFCWAVRTLRRKDDEGRWRRRSPAMAAGLANHVWSWQDWFARPAVQSA